MRKHTLFLLSAISIITLWSMSELVSGDSDSVGNICLTKRFPTLMYHHIRNYEQLSDTARDISVSPQELDEQMRYLRDNGYKTITPRDITGNMVPCDAIMITFDDGYYDNYLSAYPILAKYDFTAVVSLVIARLDESDYLMGHDVVSLQKAGWQIANHTWNHHFLTGEPRTTFQHEISESKKSLEKWFNTSVDTFVYPGGYYGPETLKATRNAGHAFAFTTQFGESDLSGSRLELKRIHIPPGTSVESFEKLLEKAKSMQ